MNRLMLAIAAAAMIPGLAAAQEQMPAQGPTLANAVYFGVGNPDEEEDRPFTVGYLSRSNPKLVWGVDFAREGTQTWERSYPSQYRDLRGTQASASFNLLIGQGRNAGEHSRIDAALLLGARQTSNRCHGSYIGFNCYADGNPEAEYDLNYGAVLTYSYKKTLVGLRVTGESAQLMLGVNF